MLASCSGVFVIAPACSIAGVKVSKPPLPTAGIDCPALDKALAVDETA